MCSPLTDTSATTFASNQTPMCSTATQETRQMIGSQPNWEQSLIPATFETRQAYISAEQAQKKETTTITHADPEMTSYASYLKGVYIHLSQSRTSQNWTYLPRCEFVQLAMIRDKELRHGGTRGGDGQTCTAGEDRDHYECQDTY